jgi:hypothetical protein
MDLLFSHYESMNETCIEHFGVDLDELHKQALPVLGKDPIHDEIALHPFTAFLGGLYGQTENAIELQNWEAEALYRFWLADKPVYVMPDNWVDGAVQKPIDFVRPPLLDPCMYIRMPGHVQVYYESLGLPLQGVYVYESYVQDGTAIKQSLCMFFVSEIPFVDEEEAGDQIRVHSWIHWHEALRLTSGWITDLTGKRTVSLTAQEGSLVRAALNAIDLLCTKAGLRQRRLHRKHSPALVAERKEKDSSKLMGLPYYQVEILP